MHPRNKLRLLAGLTIDQSLEVTPLKEAREVPNRKDVAPANEANLKKKLASCEKACMHMRNAVKALEGAPATDTDATIPQMIKDIEDLCSEMDALCKVIEKTKPIKESKNELKEMEGESEPESFNTTSQFSDGDKVLYKDGVWIVVVADAQANMVGIVPAGMVNASKEEKNKAVQMVKADALRKPSEEECEVMATDKEALSHVDDDMDVQFSMESEQVDETMHHYHTAYPISHEENEEDPINVVGQSKGNWKNMMDVQKTMGPRAADSDEPKVKVPAKVKTALKDAIAAIEKDADKMLFRQGDIVKVRDPASFEMYTNTAAAFKHILALLETGTVMDLKKAQVFASSLMGPMLHNIPEVVWDFITNGGAKRSLKDYMIDVSKGV